MKSSMDSKKKVTAIIAITLLMVSVFMVFATSVFAQELPTEQTIGPRPAGVTDDMTVPTEIILMARPNPIGLNQELLVNIWTVRAPGAGRQFKGYEITITKPSGGSVEFTMDSYVADGTAWFPWVMDEVGDWTFQVYFPGNFLPAGNYSAGEITHQEPDTITTRVFIYNDPVYVEPSTSPLVTVTVQQDYVPVWPESPLPTDYWTRPVTSENREWWTILGDFPWFGKGGGAMWDELYPDTNVYPARSGSNFDYSFVPWVQVPDSPHIVWKRMYEMGGLIGGDEGIASDIYWSPDWRHRPEVILNGWGYQQIQKPSPDGPETQNYWQCYDIRTGEIKWERPLYQGEQVPNLIEYAPSAYTLGLGVSGITGLRVKDSFPSLMSISGGYLRKYDPVYGDLIFNESIAPLTGSGGTYYMNGFCLAVQNLGSSVNVTERYRLINWTTIGSSDFEDRVVSNTSYARSSLPSRIDWESGYGAVVSNVDRGGVRWGQRVRSYDLYTGEELWDITVEAPQFSGSAAVADHGKIVIGSMYGYFIAFDLENGHEVWRTETMDYPWDVTGWGSYGMMSAYGNLYWGAPSAYYCFDWETGDTVWKFRIPAEFPFETAYGVGTNATNAETVYPFHNPGWVADGKILVYSIQHSPEPPYFRGQPMLCINATTGDLIWKLGGFSGGGQHTKSATLIRIADGYVALGARDGYMYVIGKGKSETTVSAPLTAVSKGTAMTITGTILDMSPAQPGTPCVSKDSMEVQMQHIHLQMPIDGIHHNVTLVGVPVTLSAFGSDGEYYDLGTTTSDGYYGSYGLKWTPPAEGVYRIVASFEGDDSYGSSGASTYVTVGPAPSGGQQQETEEPTTEAPTTEAPTTEAPTTEAPTTEAPTSEVPTTEQPSGEAPAFPTTEVIIVATVAVAIIIGVGVYWALRRQK
jgi:hypothetical protein